MLLQTEDKIIKGEISNRSNACKLVSLPREEDGYTIVESPHQHRHDGTNTKQKWFFCMILTLCELNKFEAFGDETSTFGQTPYMY